MAPSTQPNEALAIRPPRLPYLADVEEKFGIDQEAWRALVEAIFPNAQSPGSIYLVLAYCKRRELDVFKRNVHIVPIWDKDKRGYVDTIWPGIGELRTTAFRTKQYAGRDKTEFGEDITRTWHVGGQELTLTFPEWAQVTVYRMIDGQRVAFDGPPVFWLENFASTKDGAPNSMWQKRPRGQLDKCAEAAALRAAFPEELGDTVCSDEAPVIYQHGQEPLGAGGASVSLEAGVAGCKDRMRKAIQAKTVEPPAEPEEPGFELEPTGKQEEVPDLLADVAALEAKRQAEVWQCVKGHTFEAPIPKGGTTLGVCPTCGAERIRRLS